MSNSTLVHEDKIFIDASSGDKLDIFYVINFPLDDLKKFALEDIIDDNVENFRDKLTQELRSHFGDGRDGY